MRASKALCRDLRRGDQVEDRDRRRDRPVQAAIAEDESRIIISLQPPSPGWRRCGPREADRQVRHEPGWHRSGAAVRTAAESQTRRGARRREGRVLHRLERLAALVDQRRRSLAATLFDRRRETRRRSAPAPKSGAIAADHQRPEIAAQRSTALSPDRIQKAGSKCSSWCGSRGRRRCHRDPRGSPTSQLFHRLAGKPQF